MKVYVLKYCEFFGAIIELGIFSSLELANNAKKEILDKYPNILKSQLDINSDRFIEDENKWLDINEYELDKLVFSESDWFLNNID